MACLFTRPHVAFNFFDSLKGASKLSHDLLQALRNSLSRFPGDENTAINLFLEVRVPGRVCPFRPFRPFLDNYWAWIRESRGSGGRIDKLAVGE